MSTSKVDEITEKRKKLKAEVEQLQRELETSVDGIKTDVQDRMRPMYWIKRYPLYAAGAAAFLGFLVAGRKSPRSSGSAPENVDYIPPAAFDRSPTITEMVSGELKRAVTQRATSYLVSRLDEYLKDKIKEENEKA